MWNSIVKSLALRVDVFIYTVHTHPVDSRQWIFEEKGLFCVEISLWWRFLVWQQVLGPRERCAPHSVLCTPLRRGCSACCCGCWTQDCTIPAASAGEAVIWSCEEKPSCRLRGGGEGTALRSDALLLPLPLCLSVTLPLSSVHSLLGEAARRHTSLQDHCVSNFDPPTHHPPTFLKSTQNGEAFSLFICLPPPRTSLPWESTACTPVRWRARACPHQRRIYLRVRCPHIITAISPPSIITVIISWTSPLVTEKRIRVGGGKRTGIQGWGSTAL